MKLIATAQTFSNNDLWTEYEIYIHAGKYRVQEQDCGLGWGILSAEKPIRRWANPEEVRYILMMDTRDQGTVEIRDEEQCEKILDI